ncbi:MAG TPA: hypothetical protein VK034_31650 [Enhygromyxa sp.]|nr:hypothetical protein [Enhygromyxa sp.]
MNAGTLTPGDLNTLKNKDGVYITMGIKTLNPLEITTMFIDAKSF